VQAVFRTLPGGRRLAAPVDFAPPIEPSPEDQDVVSTRATRDRRVREKRIGRLLLAAAILFLIITLVPAVAGGVRAWLPWWSYPVGVGIGMGGILLSERHRYRTLGSSASRALGRATVVFALAAGVMASLWIVTL
jgi:hypothetical protein